MADDDDSFEPHLGRQRSLGGKRSRSALGRILGAANLARGGGPGLGSSRKFTGSRIGRGGGTGRVLARRGGSAAFGRRRVIVKARIVKLAGKGAGAAAAHLRYLQRDGTTRDGEAGKLYGRDSDAIDGAEFRGRGSGDRHQFRFIVSPEDGDDYDDLKPLTRRLMERAEEDLGTRLDWVAVDHFNTGHPHSHIIVRGVDERGQDLVIARDYLTGGFRERAAELVDLDLGPRSVREIEIALRAEVIQERLTSIDRALLRESGDDRIVAASGHDGFDQAIRTGRLNKLAEMELAEPIGAGRYRLAEGLDDTLRRMGERGDIIRTMQREFSRNFIDRPMADRVIYDPTSNDAQPLVGRIVARGFADEFNDRHYLIVDATDGRSHYVAIGKGENLEQLATGAIVRVDPLNAAVRAADRTIAEIAGANGGQYDIDAHLRHDPSATEAFAQTHVRRLEAMRRDGGGVIREPSGAWTIASDHLDRVRSWQTDRLRDRPVGIAILSALPLDRLHDADAATWLDREAVAVAPVPLREAGFGQDVRDAQARRRQWLSAQGLGEEMAGAAGPGGGLLTTLQRRELLRVSGQLADELQRPFSESADGARIDGIYRKSVDLISGRFALIERARDFTLVPWRPALEQQLGKPVSGVLRGEGISWTIGRGRSGPSIG
ncbi:relaxase/mobilization nuclease RlxS [soil metagenome]